MTMGLFKVTWTAAGKQHKGFIVGRENAAAAIAAKHLDGCHIISVKPAEFHQIMPTDITLNFPNYAENSIG